MRSLLIFWLFLLSAVAYLDRTNISIAGAHISQEFGLGNVRLGWVFSAFLVGYAASQVLGGWLATRFGPRRVLTFGVMWWGVFTAMTAAISPRIGGALALLIVIRFSLGVGEAVIYPASNQFVANWIPVEERGRANGWIFAGVGAGAGLTPPLLTWIILHYGWRASFWFSAVVGVIAGLIWYLMARDTPEEHPAVSAAELAHIQQGIAIGRSQAESVPDKAHAPSISWARLFRSREVLALTLSYFSFGYVAWIFFAWFYIYLAEARGLDLKSSALYAMLPFLGMTVASPTGGMANDWISRRYGLRLGRCGTGAVSLALAGVLLWFGPVIASAQLASVMLAAGAGVLYFAQSSYWSVTADIAGRQSGVMSGIVNMGAQIGAAVTASLTPVVAARMGWSASFRISAALALIGAVAWLVVDPGRSLTADE
ncbi:MAG TPA: MFS transporter [Edaphobacter sp.]|nr:MFS transporter [Edaphobacter sp.]